MLVESNISVQKERQKPELRLIQAASTMSITATYNNYIAHSRLTTFVQSIKHNNALDLMKNRRR